MIINLLCIKSDGVSNEFGTAKESDGNQELKNQMDITPRIKHLLNIIRHQLIQSLAVLMTGSVIWHNGFCSVQQLCKVQLHPWSRCRGAASP
ncbi:hypothetical protein SETIT_8G099500v2 [Setaria italica]|uniref:Uncharacterized protein n=1 Tax=Setaria italica TaxID=4555 RepID=A0A368S6C4_SETIT|nr:hypothetical protein SETIT_8G099500v2 [Setaria italica]